jgi:transposase-like protein
MTETIDKTEMQERRMAKAYAILSREEKPEQIDENTFRVLSQNGNWYYTQKQNGKGWECDCPDHNKREIDCKHIFAVKFWMQFKDQLKIEDVGDAKPLNFQNCSKCGSHDIIKNGVRETKKGIKQRFACKDCGFTFILEDEFSGIFYDSEIVCKSMDLYFSGLSTRKVAFHLKQFYNTKISHVTIYNWVTNFSKIINEYVEQFQPELSDVWHADETMIKVKNGGTKRGEGKYVWLWNVMDRETRFLITNLVSTKRGIKDARRVFRQAKDIGGKPDVMITDSLASYYKAFHKEFGRKKDSPRLIQNVGIQGRTNNNRIERYHGELKERTKVQRGEQNEETSDTLLKGMKDYHNFIRPHSALDGKTPAEVAGIDLGLGEKKWEGLIRQSVNGRNGDKKHIKKVSENRSLDSYF